MSISDAYWGDFLLTAATVLVFLVAVFVVCLIAYLVRWLLLQRQIDLAKAQTDRANRHADVLIEQRNRLLVEQHEPREDKLPY